MKKPTFIVLAMVLTIMLWGQNGTSGSPFTSLAQARSVSSAGVYYFDINNESFSTYVNSSGWVQIALDYGNGNSYLTQTRALSGPGGSRGILHPDVLAEFTSIAIIGITSSTGNIEVTTTNSTLLSRIASNTTLHQGTRNTNENTINDDWTGTGSANLTVDAWCASSNTKLHANVIHICGAFTSFIWYPLHNYQRDEWNSGEIGNSEYFQLWVRSSGASLPVELIQFDAQKINNQVLLNWQTASEIDNSHFEIERSKDGLWFESLGRVEGNGNSKDLMSYKFYDRSPYNEINYYRLKQVDFDGDEHYSKVIRVDFINYPTVDINKNSIIIRHQKEVANSILVINSNGQDVTDLLNIDRINNGIKLNTELLNNGLYLIHYKGNTYKFLKTF